MHSKHYLQWQKIESLSSKIRNKTRVSTLTTTTQHSIRSPSPEIREGKETMNTDWKRSKALTVCR